MKPSQNHSSIKFFPGPWLGLNKIKMATVCLYQAFLKKIDSFK